MDDLVRHVLRDTDYHLRYGLPGDPVTAALTPLGPAHALDEAPRLRWRMVPRPPQLPTRATATLRRLWAMLSAGRSVAVVSPAHRGAWEGAPVDDCTPDDDDRVFGWWSRDECATLLAELAAVEGEPLPPRPIADPERRWLDEMKARHGDALWAKTSAELEARARTFIPWDDAAGLHAVRTVATRAHALGCGLGFFLC